jgi:lysyl-tRNA synthetase class II
MATNLKFEEEYLDVLQNIEFSIVKVYRQHPEMADWDALDAIEALIRSYTAEARGRSRPKIRFSDLSKLVFETVETMCEWRLGRERLLAEDDKPSDVTMEPKTMDEIIACLKRVRKSIRRWNKESGRQGYLNFVSEFIR